MMFLLEYSFIQVYRARGPIYVLKCYTFVIEIYYFYIAEKNSNYHIFYLGVYSLYTYKFLNLGFAPR